MRAPPSCIRDVIRSQRRKKGCVFLLFFLSLVLANQGSRDGSIVSLVFFFEAGTTSVPPSAAFSHISDPIGAASRCAQGQAPLITH